MDIAFKLEENVTETRGDRDERTKNRLKEAI
jgi:hypothetical protein